MDGRFYLLPGLEGSMATGTGQILAHVMRPLVADFTARHLDLGVATLVTGRTVTILGVAADADHHGAGNLSRYRIKTMAHAAVAVATEQGTEFAVQDLALDDLVGDHELVARDLFWQVAVADNTLLRLRLAYVANEAAVPRLLSLGLPVSVVTGHTAKGTVRCVYRLGFDHISLGVRRINSTGLQSLQ